MQFIINFIIRSATNEIKSSADDFLELGGWIGGDLGLTLSPLCTSVPFSKFIAVTELGVLICDMRIVTSAPHGGLKIK